METNLKTGFRPLVPGDARQLALMADNPRVAANLRDYFPQPYTIADAADFIALCNGMDPVLNFGITFGDTLVGVIGYVPDKDVQRISAEIGYWIGEPYWNRGIASRVVRDFSRYVFDNSDIIHLYAGVFSFNPASVRVLEKAGYSPVGVMHRCAVKQGRVIDLHYLELCKE